MSEKKLAEILFEVSMNVTRKIGYILSYCYETCIAQEMPISKEAIIKASVRYYNEVVEKYFKTNEFVKRPFHDKISIENHKGLLKEMVKYMSGYGPKKKKHSHFIVNDEFSYLLDNLNLNGYISTYNQIKDKNQQNLTVFCLDYGLCASNNINYEKPEFTTTKSILDVTLDGLILKYFNNTQALRCPNGHELEYNMIDRLKLFDMACPECHKTHIYAKCDVIPVDKELILRLKQIEASTKSLIGFGEYCILEYMKAKNNALSIYNISENIDRSPRTVQKLIDQLMLKKYVDQDREASIQLSKDVYFLTEGGDRLISNLLNSGAEI